MPELIATTSSSLNIGNTIYGDLSTGYVGIGATALAAKLEILDPSTAMGATSKLFRAGYDGNWGFYMKQNNVATMNMSHILGTQFAGGTDIDTRAFKNGSVGIGTMAPTSKVELYGAGQATAA